MSKARQQANLSSDGNLFADISNDRVGIGSVVPTHKLHVNGTSKFDDDVKFEGTTAAYNVLWDKSANALKFSDGGLLQFGASNDLQIWHDTGSSHNYIRGTSSTRNYIQHGSHNAIITYPSGAVALYHNNSKKLETLSTGAKVTGNLEVTGVLTYDDVTSIDSVGIVTARQGIHIDDSIVHIGDTDTKIRFPSNDNISMEIAGTERFDLTAATLSIHGNIRASDYVAHRTVDSLGVKFYNAGAGNNNTYVGLGAEDNGTSGGVNHKTFQVFRQGSSVNRVKIDASGNLNVVTGKLKINDTIEHIGDSNTKIRFSANDQISFETAGLARLYITPGGDIRQQWNDLNFLGSYYDADYYMGFTFGATTRTLYIDNRANDTRADIAFRTKLGQATPVERLRINSSGNVMIGDSDTDNAGTGSDNLVIGANSGDNGLTIVSGSGNYNGTIRFSDGANSGSDYMRGTIQYYHGGNYMRFYTDATERLRIDSSGRLLLGTTTEGDTAADNLTIADSGASGITIRSGTTSTGNIYFSDATSGTAEYDGYIQYSQNTRHLSLGTATNERFRITSTGEVNIGGNYSQTNAPLCVTTGANDYGIRLISGSNVVCEILNNDNAGNSEIRGYYNNNSGTRGTGYMIEANGDTYFNPGGTIGLIIKANGRVGINDTTPERTLDVAGDVFAASFMLKSNSSPSGSIQAQMYKPSDNTLAFATNGANERLRITSGGQTIVKGVDDQDNFVVDVANTQFAVHTDATDGELSLRAQDGSGSNNAKYMTFFTHPSGSAATERLRITAAGYVQVRSTQSATTGGAPLYVGVTGKSSITYGGGQDDTACVRIEDEGGTNSYYHGLELRTKQGGDVRLYAQDGGNDVADFVVATDNSGIAERLRIKSTGEVIIKSSHLTLECANTATTGRYIGITNAAGSTGWTFGNGVIANAHQFVIYDNTEGRSRLLIDSDGRVRTNNAAGTGHDGMIYIQGASDPAAMQTKSNLTVRGEGGNGFACGTYEGTANYGSWIQSGYVQNFSTAIYPLVLNPNGGVVCVGNYDNATTTDAGLLRVQSRHGTNYYNDAALTIEHVNGSNAREQKWHFITASNQGTESKSNSKFRQYAVPYQSTTLNRVWTDQIVYAHVVGFNQFSWYRFNTRAESNSRGGSARIAITWSTRHASGTGYGEYSFAWRDIHNTSRIDLFLRKQHFISYTGGSYYGWSSSPEVIAYSCTGGGSAAAFFLRLEGHGNHNSSTYDMSTVHQFHITHNDNDYGGNNSSFEFVGNSNPSDLGSSLSFN